MFFTRCYLLQWYSFHWLYINVLQTQTGSFLSYHRHLVAFTFAQEWQAVRSSIGFGPHKDMVELLYSHTTTRLQVVFHHCLSRCQQDHMCTSVLTQATATCDYSCCSQLSRYQVHRIFVMANNTLPCFLHIFAYSHVMWNPIR